uniref:Uncharacterized protein n=1 Tax=Arundo donax TaxID=35708 RepID=A0A0A9GK42_ARUDO
MVRWRQLQLINPELLLAFTGLPSSMLQHWAELGFIHTGHQNPTSPVPARAMQSRYPAACRTTVSPSAAAHSPLEFHS